MRHGAAGKTREQKKEEGRRRAKKEVNLFPREFLDPRGGTLSCELSRDARSQRSSHHNARRLTRSPRVSKSSATGERERESVRKAEGTRKSERDDVT